MRWLQFFNFLLLIATIPGYNFYQYNPRNFMDDLPGRIYRLNVPCEIRHKQGKELNCEGVIHALPTRYHKCCKTKIYDDRTEECCNGKIFNPLTHSCCIDLDRYHPLNETNPQTSHYNREKYIVIPELGAQYCCGNISAADFRTRCCQGKKYTKEERKEFLKCLTTFYCEGKLINYTTERCCNGVLHSIQAQKLHCCGNKTYDYTKEICCKKERIIAKENEDDYSCCKDKPYNAAKQICCKDSSVITRMERNHRQCCGQVSYMGERSKIEGCYNGKVYKVHEEICCKNNVLKRESQTDECCGDKVFNSNTHLCCNEVLHEKATGVCCNTTFHAVPDAREHDCCGSELLTQKDYGTLMEQCCREPRPTSPKCCEYRIINGFTEACCGGKVIAKEADDQIGCCALTGDYWDLMKKAGYEDS